MEQALQTRVLRAADLTLFRKMLDLFGHVFEEPHTYCAHQPEDAYLRNLLESQTFVAIAAVEGAEVVGGLAGYVLQKFEQARSELYIYDLAVAENRRRRGVASAMIAAVKRIAAERGIYVILVQADDGDEPAIALYNRFGSGEKMWHFDIDVADQVA